MAKCPKSFNEVEEQDDPANFPPLRCSFQETQAGQYFNESAIGLPEI